MSIVLRDRAVFHVEHCGCDPRRVLGVALVGHMVERKFRCRDYGLVRRDKFNQFLTARLVKFAEHIVQQKDRSFARYSFKYRQFRQFK